MTISTNATNPLSLRRALLLPFGVGVHSPSTCLAARWLGLFAVLFVSACSTRPYVESDYDTTFNFSGINSYYLMKTPSDEINNQAALSLADQRIQDSIVAQMQQRGLNRVDSPESADISVSYHVTTREKTRYNNYNLRVGYGFFRYPFGAGYGYDTQVDQYVQGTLLVDVIDPKENRVVWRGSGMKRLSDHWSREQTREKIAEYVSAIFDEFPIQ